MRHAGQNRGVALLIVLMIVALVSILATEMGTRLQLQVQRTMNIKDNNQAYWYAMGAEAFARKSIRTLLDDSDGKISLSQPWNQEVTYPLDGGGIRAQLEDMQSCFNLNAILQGNSNQQSQQATAAMDAFHRMLLEADLEIDDYVADTVRDSLADWIDEDDQMRSYGAEDSEYESRQFPYLAANGMMSSQSEFRLVNGVAPSWMNKLLPLICVVPDSDQLKINVNTVTTERSALLAGLTGLSKDQAEGLISSRPTDGWDDVNDFLNEPVVAALSLSQSQQDWFSVDSEYFILHTKTQYNEATFTLTSVFHAPQGQEVTIVRREFGGVD